MKPFQRLVRDPLVTASFEGLVPPAMVMLLIYGISLLNPESWASELTGRLVDGEVVGEVDGETLWMGQNLW